MRGTSDDARRTAAFREVYERHHAAICAYFARRTAREDVHDLAAETFVVAWRKLPRDLDEPLPWLYGVARLVLANHYRKRSRDERAAGAGRNATPPDPADLISGDRGLAAAFARLTPQQREAIRLVAWEGLSQRDAATAAGCSAATFAVRLSRARKRLAAMLEAEPESIPTTWSPNDAHHA